MNKYFEDYAPNLVILAVIAWLILAGVSDYREWANKVRDRQLLQEIKIRLDSIAEK